MREHDERRLRAALQQTAEQHRPDRDAIFDRMIRNRAEQPRAARLRLNPVAAAAGVAAVVVVSFAGIRMASSPSPDEDQVAAPTAAVATTATPSRTAAAPAPEVSSAEGSLPPTSRPPASSTPGSKSPKTPPSTSTEEPSSTDKDGYLTAAAGLNPNPNPNWSQSELKLSNTKKVTALEVTITIKKTAGLATPGQFCTIPKEYIAEQTYSDQGDKIVYHWKLASGPTLAPGEYIFAAQYNHATGREPTADTYRASTSAGSDQASVKGSF